MNTYTEYRIWYANIHEDYRLHVTLCGPTPSHFVALNGVSVLRSTDSVSTHKHTQTVVIYACPHHPGYVGKGAKSTQRSAVWVWYVMWCTYRYVDL